MNKNKRDARSYFFNAEIDDGRGTRVTDYPVLIKEFDEISARRWLVSHFLKSGWRCIKIDVLENTEELPDLIPVMPHRPGEND